MDKRFSIAKTCRITLLALLVAARLPAQEPVFPPLDTLPVLDSLPDYVLSDYARHLANQATAIRDVFSQIAEHWAAERETAENQILAIKEDTTVSKEDRKALEKTLKAAKTTEKSAQKQLQQAQKAAEFAEKVVDMDSTAQRKNMPKAYKSLAALLPKPAAPVETPISEVIGPVSIADPAAQPPTIEPEATPTPASDSLATAGTETPDTAKPKKEKKERKQAPAGPVFKSYDPAADVMLHPPERPCRLTVDTRDEFSGERRQELAREELFRFTNPSLKPYFTDHDHIICQAALACNAGSYVLHLLFTINDVNAQRAFGGLPRNGIAVLKFLDGETYTLYNLRADEGQNEGNNPVFTFHGQYGVDPGMLKKMQKALLDKVRIAWSTGYEDYDIQNVDLLQRQTTCLAK